MSTDPSGPPLPTVEEAADAGRTVPPVVKIPAQPTGEEDSYIPLTRRMVREMTTNNPAFRPCSFAEGSKPRICDAYPDCTCGI